MNRDYLIKLTLAIYRVTELFPKEEPLKYKIREMANEILANLLVIYSDNSSKTGLEPLQRKVFCQIEILEALFELAEAQKWINSQNFLILKREYDKIKKDIEEQPKIEHQHKPSTTFETKVVLDKSAKISINQRLTERQKKILEILKKRDKIQVWELQKVFPKLSKRTLRRDLESLLSKKLIIRQGKDKDICYRLVGQD